MGKHQIPRRARLLPVLGIIGLVAALLAVGRFAMANVDDEGADPAASSFSTSGSPTVGSTPEDPAIAPDPSATEDKTDKADKKRERKRQERLRNKVQVAADGLAPDPAAFRIGSFNVLGASHTAPGGNKPRYAGGATRMAWTVQLMRGNNLSVVGLQEYEPPQHGTFSSITGGSWGVYPGMQVGTKGVRNSIAWDTAVWELVEGNTIPIPYFSGNLVPMPYILLKHKETERLAWFINIHNPASTRGPAQHWRDIATQKEIALMNQLQAPEREGELGIPTFLMGDFNEKSEAFCRVTAGAAAQAANGGTASPCQLPSNHGIDWIFGSTPGVTFSGYQRLNGGLVDRASDHPLIFADVSLDGEAPTAE